MFYDDHNPPHFHAEYQDFEAIIEIESGVIKGEMPRRALRLIYDWLDIYEDELTENWRRSQTQETLFKIQPLK
jgi:hypothetical protein